MTTSTPRIKRRSSEPAHARAGFTLVEVVVAATLSVLILTGVLSAFLMVGRTGYAAGNYSEMEAQTRNALEIFGADARKASDIRWIDAQTITLFVVGTGTSATAVTYAYDPVTTSDTYRSFYRLPGEANSTAPRAVLVRNVAPDFFFKRFKLEQSGGVDNTAASDLETKQIQVTLRAIRTGATTVATTQSAVSARYILRNKRVSN
jgi:Tfp pilus assembly protein PilV